MNRRGFLSLLGLGATGMVLDPEALLWRPGAKTIFLPPVVRHSLLISPESQRAVVRIFAEQLKFAKAVNRSYAGDFALSGSVGYTVNARLPERYYRSGAARRLA